MTLVRSLAAVLAFALGGSAHAAYTLVVSPSNPYDEIIERGRVSLRIEVGTGGAAPTSVLDCSSPSATLGPDRHFDIVLHAVAG